MASFSFKPKYLNSTTVNEVTINQSLGRHSQLYLDIAHSYEDVDLATLLGQKIECKYDDGKSSKKVFSGIITGIEYQASRLGSKHFKLAAMSDSSRSDEIRRNRVFQKPKATLKKIVEEVAQGIPCDTIFGNGTFDKKVPLSIQYNETDFMYLRRLLASFGIPLIVDRNGSRLRFGQLGGSSVSLKKDDIKFDLFVGSTISLQEERKFGVGSGILGEFKKGVDKYNRGLRRPSEAYFSNHAFEDSRTHQEASLKVHDEHFYSMVSGQRRISTHNKFLQVGQSVSLDGESLVVLSSDTYYYNDAESNSGESIKTRQTHILVSSKDLIPLPEINTHWRGIDFLAKVSKNTGDPKNLGRVQVKFDWEQTQEKNDKNQCWVDVLTPYAGAGESADKEETYGINMLPEEGEDVLVRFIDAWDDKPVIIGSIRRQIVHESVDTAQHKTIRMPKGNRIDLISTDKREEIRIRAGDSKTHHIDIITEDGKTKILFECDDEISLKGKSIVLDSESIELKASNNIKIESQAGLDLSGTSGVEMKSSANVKVKGAVIQLN